MGTMPANNGMPVAVGRAAGTQGIHRSVAWRGVYRFFAGNRGHSCLQTGNPGLKGLSTRRNG